MHAAVLSSQSRTCTTPLLLGGQGALSRLPRWQPAFPSVPRLCRMVNMERGYLAVVVCLMMLIGACMCSTCMPLGEGTSAILPVQPRPS
jgi:hypothetical protein